MSDLENNLLNVTSESYSASNSNSESLQNHPVTIEEIEISNNIDVEDKKATKKKEVRFNSVHLYYFDRTQGFAQCIPSDEITNKNNSITLGMSFKHSHTLEFNQIEDYLKFKRKNHLEKLDEEKEKILLDLNVELLSESDFFDLDSDLDDESRKIIEITSNKEQFENINIDLPINMDLFCPILNPIERRDKLTECGVIEIDESESKEIKQIKKSREICGCKCTQLGVQCGTNELCTCFSNGIGCQLDKTKFPCDCTVRKCKNPFGLKRFDQKSVLKHYKEVFSDKYSPATTTPNISTIVNLDSDLENNKPVNRRKRKRSSQFYTPKKRKM